MRSATRLWVPLKSRDIWRRPWGRAGAGWIFRLLGLCSSSATANKKMKEGRVSPTPHAVALGHQRPRCGGARQRRLLCVATATPQSRRGSAQWGRRWALLPYVDSRFSLKQRPRLLYRGMASAQGFLSMWSLGPTAIPEEVDRVVLPSPAPEIHLSVARCCCRQDPRHLARGPLALAPVSYTHLTLPTIA